VGNPAWMGSVPIGWAYLPRAAARSLAETNIYFIPPDQPHPSGLLICERSPAELPGDMPVSDLDLYGTVLADLPIEYGEAAVLVLTDGLPLAGADRPSCRVLVGDPGTVLDLRWQVTGYAERREDGSWSVHPPRLMDVDEPPW
jgi:hypothetical protein